MGQRAVGSTKRPVLWAPLALGAATLCYVSIGGGLSPFTWPAMVSTTIGGLVIFVVAWRRSNASTAVLASRSGLVAWAAWLAAVTGWELWALSMHPRSSHPTLSSLLNNLIETHPGRSVALLAWLGLGWWLARR
jgi:Na+/proline symporter